MCDTDSFVYIVVIGIVGENFLDGACVNERVDYTCINKSELCVCVYHHNILTAVCSSFANDSL